MTKISCYLVIFETKSYDVFDSQHSVTGLVTHSDHTVFVRARATSGSVVHLEIQPTHHPSSTSHQTVYVKNYDSPMTILHFG